MGSSGLQFLWVLFRGGNKKKNNLATLPGFEDESAMDTPIVRYCGVSSIEHSHRAPITDIQWLPDHMELSRLGEQGVR